MPVKRRRGQKQGEKDDRGAHAVDISTVLHDTLPAMAEDWNFNYLRCFAAVATTLNISDAARDLEMTQPSVSRQIRLLEEQIGAPLFVRDRRGVHLTEEGRRLSEQVVPLVQELGASLAAVRDEAGSVEGEVRFGTLAEIGQSTLMPEILAFQKKHPGLRVAVEYAKEHELVEALRTGDIDAIVVTADLASETIRSFRLLTERVVLVAAASIKRDVEDEAAFASSEIVSYRRRDPLLGAYLATHYPRLTVARLRLIASVNAHRSMIDAVETLGAYAVMPIQSVAAALKSKRLRIASRKELEGPLHLAWIDTPPAKRKTRLLVEHLQKSAKGVTR